MFGFVWPRFPRRARVAAGNVDPAQVTYLIFRRGPHEGNAVVLAPQQSPQGIETTLEEPAQGERLRTGFDCGADEEGRGPPTLMGVYHLFWFWWRFPAGAA